MQNLNIVYLSAALWLSLTSALAQYVDHPVPQYPEQWNSSWITHPGIDKTAHNLVHFRKSFQLEQVPDQFIIHISGDNRYRLYVETSANCKNYHHFRLIFPDNIYHKEIWEGFADYCLDHKIKFDISPDLCNAEITAGQLLIIKNDEDLAYAVRYCREHQLELGKDVGIICYNDSTLKEVLAGGISVITPDFHEIGKQVANIVMTQDFGKSKGNYKFIRRDSF